jgi:guanylate kinase
MTLAIMLYGPPASGKDTITRELEALGSDYVHFPRLKAGGDRVSGYRLTTESALHVMRAEGDILYSNARYGATYVIDRPYLDRIVEHGEVPILHLGQVAGIKAVARSYPAAHWLVVGLWCSRDEAGRRLATRSDSRAPERLTVWDATLAELRSADPGLFTLQLNTGQITAARAARIIDALVRVARREGIRPVVW